MRVYLKVYVHEIFATRCAIFLFAKTLIMKQQFYVHFVHCVEYNLPIVTLMKAGLRSLNCKELYI